MEGFFAKDFAAEGNFAKACGIVEAKTVKPTILSN